MSLLLWIALAMAQDTVPVPDGEVTEKARGTFDDSEYSSVNQMREVYESENGELSEEVVRLRKLIAEQAIQQGYVTPEEIEKATARVDGVGVPTSNDVGPPAPGSKPPVAARPGSGAPSAGGTKSALPASGPFSMPPALNRPGVGDPVGRDVRPTPTGPQALVFPVAAGSSGFGTGTEEVTVIPTGAYVKVRVLTGVEATARDELPMLVQADYAMVGPNRTRIDMKGCMLILQVKAELSVDRVVGQAVRMSCIRDDGESVVREVNGYLAGEDSTFGVIGKLITRQGRVLAASAIAALAEGAGDAVSAAQTTTTVVQSPLGGTGETAKNVDGSMPLFVGGSAVANASENIADWYLKYAEQLLPAIAVGSGRDVWVVLLESVEMPTLRTN